jgi:hypothetical protein
MVMKHPTVAIALTHFQRGPSFSTRVTPGTDARRALIYLFEQRGICRIVGLLAKLLDAQGKTKSIDAFLQRMMHNYQIGSNEDEFMVIE